MNEDDRAFLIRKIAQSAGLGRSNSDKAKHLRAVRRYLFLFLNEPDDGSSHLAIHAAPSGIQVHFLTRRRRGAPTAKSGISLLKDHPSFREPPTKIANLEGDFGGVLASLRAVTDDLPSAWQLVRQEWTRVYPQGAPPLVWTTPPSVFLPMEGAALVENCIDGLKPPVLQAVVVTALSLERQAVLEHVEHRKEVVHEKGTVYTTGEFGCGNVFWKVAVVEVGPGNAAAAQETERAISFFNPQVVLFVGVAGGLKDVDLGDVVAATCVYGYESGKQTTEFHPRPDVYRSAYPLEQRAKAEAAKNDWRLRIKCATQTKLPRVHVGPIAAGEKVIACRDSAPAELLRSNYGNALAVEMEGKGFLLACTSNMASSLIVRGISDMLEKKGESDAKGYQEIAASHASAFAFEVLAKLAPRDARKDALTAVFSNQQNEQITASVPASVTAKTPTEIRILEEIRPRVLDATERNLPTASTSYGTVSALANSGGLDRLRDAYTDSLVAQLRSALDRRCDELIRVLRGLSGTPEPTPEQKVPVANNLAIALSEGGSNVSVAVRAVGWAAVADALANIDRRCDEARLHFNKALEEADQLPPDSEERRYILRVDAKLLYLEGRKEEAIQSLRAQDTPKAINSVLRIYLIEGRIADAMAILGQHPVMPEWAEAAILVYGEASQLEKALDVHAEMSKTYRSKGDDISNRELDIALAHAYRAAALRAVGVPPGTRTYLSSLTPEAEKRARDCFRVAQSVAEYFAYKPDNMLSTEALELCMDSLMLLADYESAARYAACLPKEYRSRENVAQALVSRLKSATHEECDSQ